MCCFGVFILILSDRHPICGLLHRLIQSPLWILLLKRPAITLVLKFEKHSLKTLTIHQVPKHSAAVGYFPSPYFVEAASLLSVTLSDSGL